MMLPTVKESLDACNVTYNELPGREGNNQIISLNLTGNNTSFRTFLDVKESEERLIVYIDSPIKISDNKRSKVAEFLMRVNYNLVIGNFEIDFRDGEVRYRASVDVEGSHISKEMVKTLVFVSAATADRFFPGMMAVMYANKDPLQAYEEIKANRVVEELPHSTSQ